MARNVKLQGLRGNKASMPVLNLCELFLSLDTNEMYVGATPGNIPVATQIFNTAGVLQPRAHIVTGRVVVTGGTITVTLAGAAAFTSATSFICVAMDISVKNRSPQIVQNSGTSITFIANAGDIVQFFCIGN